MKTQRRTKVYARKVESFHKLLRSTIVGMGGVEVRYAEQPSESGLLEAGRGEWNIGTRHGNLRLSTHGIDLDVFGRFDVPVKGMTNPFTGKWNHHFPSEWTAIQAVEDFVRVMGMVA